MLSYALCAEAPLYFYATQADSASIRAAADQCAETGFEAIILSFGSGEMQPCSFTADRNIFHELLSEMMLLLLFFVYLYLSGFNPSSTNESYIAQMTKDVEYAPAYRHCGAESFQGIPNLVCPIHSVKHCESRLDLHQNHRFDCGVDMFTLRA